VVNSVGKRDAALRALPSVSALLADARVRTAAEGLLPELVSATLRRAQEAARTRILAGESECGDVVDAATRELRLLRGDDARTLINGTGVIIQTNLGRAPVSVAAAEAMREAASNYLALETRRDSGVRGGRGADVSLLMRALTGAERTLVVNNNAAAVTLTLAALAHDREVVVSRGEAVEIGGGFRVPDVLRQSGARLVEVGTTNRTYLADYAHATGDETAAYLRVHASNFAVIGFTATPDLGELARLAHERGVLALEDVGSGCLLDTAPYGLAHEPTLGESIASDVDVVCASGDKLLGGPQAGLIMGRADIVERIATHPLARAVRADKTCLAGLAATLRHYARGEAGECVPVWWSITRELEWLRARAQLWRDALPQGVVGIIETQAVVGGGSLPGKTLPSYALTFANSPIPPHELARLLRTGAQPVVPRVIDDRVTIDARTVLPDQDTALIGALRAALAAKAS
jgi:L-seryl-tRNA(Ser) seleniumtransferase